MEYIQAQKLREQWGNKPCDHPGFEKLYYTGAFLVTYVCTTCGEDFTIPQKMEIEEERKTMKSK
jgi:hypothetical protein